MCVCDVSGGAGLARETSMKPVSASQQEVVAMQAKIAKLEKEMAELRALMTSHK